MHYFRLIVTVVFFIFLIPTTAAEAAVIINEVAWMGNSESANDEWIELYNTGDSVNVDGWTLSDGMKLDIELSGTIEGNSYAVLERTDDSSVPGSAFLIYTGALTNSGATLVLRRSDDSIEDQVAGGDSWENIGGDNTTKETAQYTSGGWITAAATPGNSNAEVDNNTNTTEVIESVASNSSGNDSSSNSKNTIVSGLLDDDFGLSIIAPNVAYVNQEISITAEPDGVSDNFLNYIKYHWSLGDGSADRHRHIKYTYNYPGEYVIVLSAKYKTNEQVARKTIKVLPVNFSITRNSEGDIQINNDAKYEINLSGYQVSGNAPFKLPENTILLPGGTITIPKERVGASSVSLVRLFDQEKVLVASTNMQRGDEESVDNATLAVNYEAVEVNETDADNFSFGTEEQPLPTVAAVSTTTFSYETTSSSTDTANQDDTPYLVYMSLLGVMGVGVTGLLFKPQ